MTTETLLINTIGEYPIQVGIKIPEWVRIIQESCDDEAPIAGDGMRYFLVNWFSWGG